MTNTVLIVPALTDIAGQCSIVMAEGRRPNALRDYREKPESWREVGKMRSDGRIVCIEAIPGLVQELRDCEPLIAGLVLYV